jgi:hypothetical protein
LCPLTGLAEGTAVTVAFVLFSFSHSYFLSFFFGVKLFKIIGRGPGRTFPPWYPSVLAKRYFPCVQLWGLEKLGLKDDQVGLLNWVETGI